VKSYKVFFVAALAVILVTTLTACQSSPKERAKDFVKFIPEEFGEWEQTDRVELLSGTVSNKGHITLQFEGPDDAIAYIVIEAHPSADASQVAATDRERELLLMGLVLEANRAPQQVTAQVAQNGRIRYALLEDNNIVVEVDALAAPDAEEPVSEEAFDELLTVVRNAYAKVSEE
jgi:hypothetical protein